VALSNWDTLAFGPDGKSCSGTFKSEKNDTFLELYKNWAHVGSKKMWQDKGCFTGPYIASIESGEMVVGPFRITAARHDAQNSIFIYAEETIYHPDYGHKDDAPKPVTRRFAGIGCYGYKNQVKAYLEHLGRLDEYEKFDWATYSSNDGPDGVFHDYLEKFEKDTDKKLELIDMGPDADDIDNWEGVNKETLAAFHAWLDAMPEAYGDYPEWVAKVKAENPVGYNQGDAYIAVALGMPVPVSAVGEARPEPLITQALKK